MTLKGNELDEYPKLQFFRMWTGKLQRVPGNFFHLTPSIKYIDFDGNDIKHVGKNLIENLRDLQVADFQNNFCINTFASDESEVPALLEVLFQNCTDIKFETTKFSPNFEM